MNPTARQARRMAPGAYISKGSDPYGEGVLNKREQERANRFFRQLGMVSPADQQGVPNNPRNVDSHQDATNPVLVANLYGDWQKLQPQTAPVQVPVTPPAARLMAQPWMQSVSMDLQDGINKMMVLQARTGRSPVDLPPNDLVLNNQPVARPGISGFEGSPLPPAPQLGMEDLMTPVRMGQMPLPPSQDLDPRFAPYQVAGQPSDALLPRMSREFRGGRGKPASLPTTA